MSYQVLARKWRPKTFQELVGQEHVVRALSNALEQQRLHHAYLFTGTRGVGKTTLARILAKALNCETGITATPCGVCSACTEIDKGRFVDLLEVDAASNTKVDQMRDLLENAQYAPTVARFKVFIIDEVHMLSTSSFNAMLKTLEEPPAHVKFILATTDPQKMPVTVLSRCLQFNLRQMPALAITDHLHAVLQKESISAENVALQLIARAASGSMRDALSLLDQAIAYGSGAVHEAEVRAMLGAIDQSYLFTLLKALAHGDGKALLDVARGMEERSLSFDAALSELALLLHQVALAQSVPDAIPDDLPERQQIMELSALFKPEDIQLYYQIALLGRRDLGLAPDEYAGFSMCLLRMLAFSPNDKQAPKQSSPPLPAHEKPTPAPQAPTSPASADTAPVAAATPRENLAEKLQVIQQAVAEIRSTEPSTVAFDGNWRGLVDKLKLSGMARMLAQNCALLEFEGHQMRLSVPPEHKHLLDNTYQEKLRATLKEHFGKQLQVSIEISGNAIDTPARQINQEKAARQAQAEASIKSDPFVHDLMESFGATIIPSTIKPVQ
ncbi:MAG: DNA polymerase III subunit gamma/tau [Methylophilaceae bacterium]|jgi:DNA polymerase-3 subunit gamma/tau|nr:DNA polymerase III subunit gamma/tau [Methylophilaceae bacterium]